MGVNIDEDTGILLIDRPVRLTRH